MPPSANLEKRELWLNLIALGFHPQSQEAKYGDEENRLVDLSQKRLKKTEIIFHNCTIQGCHFDESMFDKSNKKAFEVVAHFLFNKLNHKQAQELFRYCFPATDKKAIQEFRKACFQWLKRLSEEHHEMAFPKVSSPVLMSPGGREFIHLMFYFSRFVLFTISRKVDPDGVLYPSIMAKNKKLTSVQCKWLRSIGCKEFEEFQQKMQIIKKREEEQQLFAEEQMKLYHKLQKEKKLLLQKCSHFAGEAKLQSGKKCVEILKQQKRGLKKQISSARDMWLQIQDVVEKTKLHRAIMDSILEGGDEKHKLDGNRIQPNVPSMLLDECQEEIYQTIGTSLYCEGNINLTSLVSLCNLSLQLVEDKLHEDGIPNFERNLSFLKSQQKLHEDEKMKLFDIRNQESDIHTAIASSINVFQEQLDKKFQQTPQKHESNFRNDVYLDDLTSNSLGRAGDGDSTSMTRTHLDDTVSIARKYLLAGHSDSFLEDLISCDEKSSPLKDENVDDDNTFRVKSWSIPAEELKSKSKRIRTPAKIPKKNILCGVSKAELPQGRYERIESNGQHHSARRLEQTTTSLTPDGKTASSRKRAKGRKSMSLPSSPQVSSNKKHTTNHSTIPSTSFADLKLIEEIVKCTVDEDNDHEVSSPVVVYHRDTASQLDRSAFVPVDKIPRTPPRLSTSATGHGASEHISVLSTSVHALSNTSSSLSDENGVEEGPHTHAQHASTSVSFSNSNTSTHRFTNANTSSLAPSGETSSDAEKWTFAEYSPLRGSSLSESSDPKELSESMSEGRNTSSSASSSYATELTHSSLLSPEGRNDPTSDLLASVDSYMKTPIQSDLNFAFRSATTFTPGLRAPCVDELMDLSDSEEQHIAAVPLIAIEDETESDVPVPCWTTEIEEKRNPIDLLMASPPPDVDLQSNNGSGFILTPTTTGKQERPLVDLTPSDVVSQPLKILPTTELLQGFETPDLHRFRSVVDRKRLNLSTHNS